MMKRGRDEDYHFLKYPTNEQSCVAIPKEEWEKLGMEGTYLDNSICQFLTRLVQEEEGLSCPDDIQVFEPFFYGRFETRSQEQLKILKADDYVINWLKQFLLFKLIENEHAYIYLVDIEKSHIYIIDSLRRGRYERFTLNFFRNYLEESYSNSHRGEVKTFEASVLKVDQQEEGSNNCVLFMAGYIESVFRNSSTLKTDLENVREDKIFFLSTYVKQRSWVKDKIEILHNSNPKVDQDGDMRNKKKIKLAKVASPPSSSSLISSIFKPIFTNFHNSYSISSCSSVKKKMKTNKISSCLPTKVDDTSDLLREKKVPKKTKFKNNKKHKKIITDNKIKKVEDALEVDADFSDSFRKGMLFKCELCVVRSPEKEKYFHHRLEHNMKWMNENNLFYLSDLKSHVLKKHNRSSKLYKKEFQFEHEDYSFFHKCHLCNEILQMSNDRLYAHVKENHKEIQPTEYISKHTYPLRAKFGVCYENKIDSDCPRCKSLHDVLMRS